MPYVSYVYDSKIVGLFDSGTEAGEWISENNRLVIQLARRTIGVGVRTGHLQASHVNAGQTRTGAYERTGRVNNSASYALYVHEGTGPRIFPHGVVLKVAAGAGHPAFLARSVAGQRAKPWLAQAGAAVAASRGAGPGTVVIRGT